MGSGVAVGGAGVSVGSGVLTGIGERDAAVNYRTLKQNSLASKSKLGDNNVKLRIPRPGSFAWIGTSAKCSKDINPLPVVAG